METRASVVIIGAGIVGSAAARFLSDLGWRDVIVVDQGPLFATGGSTSRARSRLSDQRLEDDDPVCA